MASGRAGDKAVAIVGGGISGLVTASRLSSLGLDVSLFDTGERACGGRLSSRAMEAGGGGMWEFDHSTQYFTATPGSEFSKLVGKWEADGLVTRWPNSKVGTLSSGAGFQPFDDGAPRFIGVGGFKGLCDALAGESTRVVRPQWVGEMKPVGQGQWQLASNPGGKKLGTYDFVAISHNGKCAARLAGTAKWSNGGSAAEKVLRSLQCAFGVRAMEELERQRKLILSSIWVLMFVSERPLDVPWEGAHISGSPVVSWASNITAKRLHGATGNGKQQQQQQQECWVLHSTPQFARDNKVPQENIPKSKAEEVAAAMIGAFEHELGVPFGSIKAGVVFTRAQLWGAANPLTVAGVPAVFDASSHTGACGDWCSGPPCVESACESALALADAVEALLLGPGQAAKPLAAEELDALEVRWSAASTAASPLGAFPGVPQQPLGDLPAPGAAGANNRGGRGGRRGGRGARGGGGGRGGGRRKSGDYSGSNRNGSDGQPLPSTMSSGGGGRGGVSSGRGSSRPKQAAAGAAPPPELRARPRAPPRVQNGPVASRASIPKSR